MAKVARKGSAVVRAYRAVKITRKMRHKFWELGSRIGKAMGIKGDATYGENDDTGEAQLVGSSKAGMLEESGENKAQKQNPARA